VISDYDLDLDEIAAALRGRRKDLGLSQMDTAERSGRSVARVSELENGKYPNPSVAFIADVARALGYRLTLGLAPIGAGPDPPRD
jgi:transcriptional regulator with XRE-family HTH domain